ncbi:MAG: hypothetical protein C4524_11405 [Candidatus Zixiibacteriota bacterium]|nr:MAG: hypothetical protein C4524_11405 [candidate division Zixibacteria bacterium]
MYEPVNLNAELSAAKRFHGHMGPYLVVGMRMGRLFCQAFGEAPFGFRIHTSVGLQPPFSCIIDGLQVSTPGTIGNSMIRVEGDFALAAWAQKDDRRLDVRLREEVRRRIDTETTRENEERIAAELWEAPAEDLFDVVRTGP